MGTAVACLRYRGVLQLRQHPAWFDKSRSEIESIRWEMIAWTMRCPCSLIMHEHTVILVKMSADSSIGGALLIEPRVAQTAAYIFTFELAVRPKRAAASQPIVVNSAGHVAFWIRPKADGIFESVENQCDRRHASRRLLFMRLSKYRVQASCELDRSRANLPTLLVARRDRRRQSILRDLRLMGFMWSFFMYSLPLGVSLDQPCISLFWKLIYFIFVLRRLDQSAADPDKTRAVW